MCTCRCDAEHWLFFSESGIWYPLGKGCRCDYLPTGPESLRGFLEQTHSTFVAASSGLGESLLCVTPLGGENIWKIPCDSSRAPWCHLLHCVSSLHHCAYNHKLGPISPSSKSPVTGMVLKTPDTPMEAGARLNGKDLIWRAPHGSLFP